MPNRRPHDYPSKHNWQLEIEGVTQGAFAEVSGLDSETEVIKQPAGSTAHLSKVTTAQRGPNFKPQQTITFSRGYINNTELWDWVKAVMDGKIERKSGSVILCGDDGSEIMRYNFTQGWLTSATGFSVQEKGKTAVVEDIEMTVEGLERG